MNTSSTITALPHTIAQVKAHLRVFHDLEDALIGNMYEGAFTWMESRTRRYLAARTIILTSEEWIDYYCIPRKSGALTITAAIYTDTGDNIINATSLITVEGNKICPGDQPADFKEDLGITLAVGSFTNEALNNALLMLTAQWYENRGDQSIRGAPLWIEKIAGTYAYQTI